MMCSWTAPVLDIAIEVDVWLLKIAWAVISIQGIIGSLAFARSIIVRSDSSDTSSLFSDMGLLMLLYSLTLFLFFFVHASLKEGSLCSSLSLVFHTTIFSGSFFGCL